MVASFCHAMLMMSAIWSDHGGGRFTMLLRRQKSYMRTYDDEACAY